MPYTVGLDWAQDDHAVCVIDEQAQVRGAVANAPRVVHH